MVTLTTPAPTALALDGARVALLLRYWLETYAGPEPNLILVQPLLVLIPVTV